MTMNFFSICFITHQSKGDQIMKIAAMLFVFSCAMFAQGQTSEGSHSIGGRFSFSSTHTNNHSTTLLDISPEASVFLRDNLELGTSVSTQFTFDGGTDAIWGIGPYIIGILPKIP
jgi:hypothetical protein